MNRMPWYSLILVLSLATLGCTPEVSEEPVVRPVRAVQVQYGGNESTRTFSGSAQTDRVIHLSFRSSGIISLFDINLGQQVLKGELLAQLNNVEARLAQEQAVSSLNSATSEKNTAELNLERVRRLYESGTASLSEYEAAKNGFRTAEAAYKSAQRSVEIQEEQVRYGEIYSPEDGIISAVFKEVDENASAGETIAILNAGEDMEIEVGLPESVINRVYEGIRASIVLPALPGQTYAGVVTEVSPSLDGQTGTYPVTVSIDRSGEGPSDGPGEQPDNQLRSGMAANVSFIFSNGGSSANQLIVPAQSVSEDANGRYVFVIEETESATTARKRQVTVGTLTETGFYILNGLTEGEWVATAGVHTLIDGQQVALSR